MAEASQRHDWSIASHMLALTANAHRDPKKCRPFRPDDFMPRRLRVRETPLPGSITDLKVLLKKRT